MSTSEGISKLDDCGDQKSEKVYDVMYGWPLSPHIKFRLSTDKKFWESNHRKKIKKENQ